VKTALYDEAGLYLVKKRTNVKLGDTRFLPDSDVIFRGALAPAEPVTDRHGFHFGFTTFLNSHYQNKNYIHTPWLFYCD